MRTLLLVYLSILLTFSANADGGMYPISMVDKLPLHKAGLRITSKDIFNPGGKGGLVQAVVQIGGCTGSFVSPKGLIVTNHHCAFGGLAPYSTSENNLFEKGYIARGMSKELPMKGLTCKILESYKDVSAEVLKGTESSSDAMNRKKIIEQNLKFVQEKEALRNPGLEVDLSEMLPGKSYMIFRYKIIRDIRIVYIPTRAIGEFGGENDNWEWPRHTGDFSFLRAYVDKNGNSKLFDSSNVPYEPNEYLNISEGGLAPDDFVFILGFPGRTFRNQPAAFIEYQEKYLLPFISKQYEWQMNTIRETGTYKPDWLVGMQPRLKSIGNVMKNYQGKIKSVGALQLYQKKKLEEELLYSKLSNPQRREEYQSTLNEMNSLYKSLEKNNIKYLWYNQTLSENNTLKIAHYVNLLKSLYLLKDKMTPELYDSQKTVYTKNLRSAYMSLYLPYDSVYLSKMLGDAYAFQGDNQIPFINAVKKEKKEALTAKEWVRRAYKNNRILDSTYIFSLLNNKPKKLVKLCDDFMCLSDGLYSDYIKTDSAQVDIRGKIDALLPRYVELKMEAMNEQFIPDANRTLRITYGYIKGYSPVDGIYYKPFTTIAGMVEKGLMGKDYYKVNPEFLRTYNAMLTDGNPKDNPSDVPLCMLYNTDTTGGNSGSPIMNKYGQLVGINFDRTFEATINDYAWDDSYSRSIGVDMRFVLWTVKNIAQADDLMEEMFIDK